MELEQESELYMAMNIDSDDLQNQEGYSTIPNEETGPLNVENEVNRQTQIFSEGKNGINITHQKSTTKCHTKSTKCFNIRKDNLRKEVIKAIMIELIKNLENKYEIEFKPQNWDKIFGSSTAVRRAIINLKLYQLISFNKANINTIKSYIENNNINNNDKKNEKNIFSFLYYMTRTYEELYNHYVENNKYFIINYGAKKGTIYNPSFPTLSQVIEAKKNELNKEEMDEKYIKEKMKLFKEISESLISDIKNGEGERNQKKEKIFVFAYENEELEEIRKRFN